MDVSVARAAGLDFDERLEYPTKAPNITFFHASPKKTNNARILVADQPPVVKLGMSDDVVCHSTGSFSSKMGYLAVA